MGNLPFYITNPVIRRFIELANPPKEMILIVQKEVAQRICSLAPKSNILAVLIQFYAEPKIISHISKKAFFPRPKVDCSIIKIKPTNKYRKLVSGERFSKTVKTGFSQPRKQLVNNFKSDKKQVENWLLENKIKPEQRAETLTINDWIKLAKSSLST